MHFIALKEKKICSMFCFCFSFFAPVFHFKLHSFRWQRARIFLAPGRRAP